MAMPHSPPLLSGDDFVADTSQGTYKFSQQQPHQAYQQPVPLLDPPSPPPISPDHAQYQPQLGANQYQPTSSVGGKGNTILGDDSYAFRTPESSLMRKLRSRWQLFLDVITPHIAARWGFSLSILFIFIIRIVMVHRWYVICYALGIYYLNLFLGFISPKIDPAFQAANDDYDEDTSDSGPMLPTRANEEFKPFIRRLPEFKFWLAGTNATLISLFLTLFDVFDMPVYWPILLIYFIVLTIATLRQQIKHMVKYGYVPWDKGKRRYGPQREDPSSSFATTI